jgi:hypothetical protein
MNIRFQLKTYVLINIGYPATHIDSDAAEIHNFTSLFKYTPLNATSTTDKSCKKTVKSGKVMRSPRITRFRFTELCY